MFMEGNGCKQDSEQAIEWYSRSAIKGDSHGLTRLGTLK